MIGKVRNPILNAARIPATAATTSPRLIPIAEEDLSDTSSEFSRQSA